MNGDRIPPLKLASYINYDIFNKMSVRLAHIYSGDRKKFDSRANGTYVYGQGPVDPFHLVNLTASYHMTGNTLLRIGVQNLLNEDYYLPISQWDARADNYIKGNGARLNMSLKVNL